MSPIRIVALAAIIVVLILSVAVPILYQSADSPARDRRISGPENSSGAGWWAADEVNPVTEYPPAREVPIGQRWFGRDRDDRDPWSSPSGVGAAGAAVPTPDPSSYGWYGSRESAAGMSPFSMPGGYRYGLYGRPRYGTNRYGGAYDPEEPDPYGDDARD